MASATVSKTNFYLEVKDISKLRGEILSPKVNVRGTSWKFKIDKSMSNGKQCLGVYLYCVEKTVPTNWSQVASASIKLLSFSGTVKPIEKYIQPYIFEKSRLRIGTGFSVIEWSELFDASKGYVRDDTIKLEFKVEASNVNENFKELLNIEQIGESFRMTVKSVENMMAVRTLPFKLLGANFYLTGYRHHSNQIGVRLEPEGMLEKCAIDLTMSLKFSGPEPREKSQTGQMTDSNYFVMCFEDEWLKSAQAQNHATIIDITLDARKPHDAASNANRLKTDREGGQISLQCAICLDNIIRQKVSSTPCGHLFCTPCITNSVTQYKKCPSCNIATTLEQVKRFYLPV